MTKNSDAAIDLFIHPGEYAFVDTAFCLRTTLGSCIAITLWHPVRKLGGMCHYMLPGRNNRRSGDALDGKYADEALTLLFMAAGKHGTRPVEYEVKLFGGGQMLSDFLNTDNVSFRNIEKARQLMSKENLTVKAESLGGTGYRNVIFDIASGDVWVKYSKPKLSEVRM